MKCPGCRLPAAAVMLLLLVLSGCVDGQPVLSTGADVTDRFEVAWAPWNEQHVKDIPAYVEHLDFRPVRTVRNLDRYDREIWLKAGMPFPGGTVLELPVYMLGRVDVWFRMADGSLLHDRSGTWYPYVERGLKHAGVAFSLPKDGSVKELLMRIRTGAPVNFTALLWDSESWLDHIFARKAWYGLFFGGMLALFLYNLFFAFSLKDTSFLFYVAYMACLALSVVLYSGLAEEYFWPTGKTISLVLLVAALGSFFGVGFVNRFLGIRARYPRLFWFSTLVAGTGVLLGTGITLQLAFLDQPFIVPLMHLIFILGPSYYLGISFYCYFKGVRQARFLVLGMSSLLTSLFVYFLFTYGFVAYSSHVYHVLEAGLLVDALLLSLALSDRIKFLTEEKQRLDRKYAEMQKQFAQEMIRIEEQEKKKHASILHDSVGHGLLVIRQQLDDFLRRHGDQKSAASIGAMQKQCSEVMNEVRNLSHELHPHILSKLGLKTALMAVFKRSFQHRNISWMADIADEPCLPANVETAIYRIAQEAISNALKYAEASEFYFSLTRNKVSVDVEIKDDGKGFVLGHESGGLGLKMMEGHVHLLAGVFQLRSEVGEGTVIRFSIPC